MSTAPACPECGSTEIAEASDGTTMHLYCVPCEKRRRVGRVYAAWTDPGLMANFHRLEQERLRRQWPTLANALDALEETDK